MGSRRPGADLAADGGRSPLTEPPRGFPSRSVPGALPLTCSPEGGGRRPGSPWATSSLPVAVVLGPRCPRGRRLALTGPAGPGLKLCPAPRSPPGACAPRTAGAWQPPAGSCGLCRVPPARRLQSLNPAQQRLGGSGLGRGAGGCAAPKPAGREGRPLCAPHRVPGPLGPSLQSPPGAAAIVGRRGGRASNQRLRGRRNWQVSARPPPARPPRGCRGRSSTAPAGSGGRWKSDLPATGAAGSPAPSKQLRQRGEEPGYRPQLKMNFG